MGVSKGGGGRSIRDVESEEGEPEMYFTPYPGTRVLSHQHTPTCTDVLEYTRGHRVNLASSYIDRSDGR